MPNNFDEKKNQDLNSNDNTDTPEEFNDDLSFSLDEAEINDSEDISYFFDDEESQQEYFLDDDEEESTNIEEYLLEEEEESLVEPNEASSDEALTNEESETLEEQQQEEKIELAQEEVVEETDNKNKKKRTWRTTWYTKLLIFIDVCAIICFFVFYGPFDSFRQWFITTSAQSGTHKYYAYTFYTYDQITEELSQNQTIQTETETDTSQIVISDNVDTGHYSSEYEQEILEHDEDEDYKIIHWEEDDYEAWLTVIYDPSRLELVMAESAYGDYITTFAANNDAIIAINASGYNRYSDDTLYAQGSIILDGEIYSNSGNTETMVCLTYDNILMLSYCTAEEAVEKGARWGFVFGPFLIVNGVKATFEGNGGYGYRARTAIAQRQDGIILLLTIDGSSGAASGASMVDLADIFERYGAYNAVNLDGGGSTMLAVNGELINDPVGWGYSGERHVYNAIIFK